MKTLITNVRIAWYVPEVRWNVVRSYLWFSLSGVILLLLFPFAAVAILLGIASAVIEAISVCLSFCAKKIIDAVDASLTVLQRFPKRMTEREIEKANAKTTVRERRERAGIHD